VRDQIRVIVLQQVGEVRWEADCRDKLMKRSSAAHGTEYTLATERASWLRAYMETLYPTRNVPSLKVQC